MITRIYSAVVAASTVALVAAGPAKAAPIDPVPNLEGTYAGCGLTLEKSRIPVIIHVIEMPSPADESKVSYSMAFVWHVNGTGNVHFPEITFQKNGKRMIVETKIVPRTEYGEIKNNVVADIQPNGSLSGVFRANSTNPGTRYLHGGAFKVSKMANGVIPAFETLCR